ncbi:DMT family transporter [Serratia ficaria]|uniref:DMT family transporter n=1 Tax=Serratia ficaria TaxID=61651 RepID=UPI00217901FC|nr:multidrug efflux SMR transporter [Serratia ficaria]CAI1242597.1 Methyl viologen resistance protein C [Serratia ficaria]CAI2030918.1 Methyl viologen resistance protein C [Serratia ficaria]CAI2538041.1 Methyl viologen resistance protein C [Serratia ficaria]CAI2539800.1 Methyl viologen resistance protein C [Serratia ficaria]CAI2794316.1 Methyl viologen resistance protein C [Serratia ficaria]
MTRGNCILFLLLAIITEIFATFMLVLSDGITRAIPAVFATLGYMVAYYSLTRALERISMGVAYALWSGIGILATNLINSFVFNQALSTGTIAGMWLVVIGVLIINLLSSSNTGAPT